MSRYCKKTEALQNIVVELNKADVLLGRGKRVHTWVGNVVFRKICENASATYLAATNGMTKDTIIENIVAKVHSEGGRFLRETAFLAVDGMIRSVWLTVPWSVIRTKIKQACRDTKRIRSRGSSNANIALKRKKDQRTSSSGEPASDADVEEENSGAEGQLLIPGQFCHHHTKPSSDDDDDETIDEELIQDLLLINESMAQTASQQPSPQPLGLSAMTCTGPLFRQEHASVVTAEDWSVPSNLLTATFLGLMTVPSWTSPANLDMTDYHSTFFRPDIVSLPFTLMNYPISPCYCYYVDCQLSEPSYNIYMIRSFLSWTNMAAQSMVPLIDHLHQAESTNANQLVTRWDN